MKMWGGFTDGRLYRELRDDGYGVVLHPALYYRRSDAMVRFEDVRPVRLDVVGPKLSGGMGKASVETVQRSKKGKP